MCRMKSMLLLKDKVFCPNYDEHSRMLDELGIIDRYLQPNFVKIEITPPSNNIWAPIDTWEYYVDQDSLPNWYVKEIDEIRCRKTLAKWAKQHIRKNDEKLCMNIANSESFYFSNCSNSFYCFSNNSIFSIDDSEVIQIINGGGYIHNSSNISLLSANMTLIENSSNVRLHNCLKAKVFNSEITKAEKSVIYASGKSKIEAGRETIVIKLDPEVEVVRTDDSAIIIEKYLKKG